VSKRSQLGTSVKKVVKAIEAGDKAQAEAAYKAAVPVLDKMTGKGIVHKNAAARQKSRLNTRIRAM
jgi:small subunit ribosomal protein S20